MQIEKRMVGPVVVLDVSGRLVLSDPGSDARFKDCVSALIADGSAYVIVNVAGVTDIDTSGLSALVSAHISLSRLSRRLKLIAPTPRLRHLLRVSRLDAVFEICDTEAEALAGFPAG